MTQRVRPTPPSIARQCLLVMLVAVIVGSMSDWLTENKCRLCRFQHVLRSPYCLRHKNRLAKARKVEPKPRDSVLKERQREYIRGPGRFSTCRSKASRRGIAWELSREEFSGLVVLPCHYCGLSLPPSGSGLDRLDNSRGYSADNVVPCCTDCNLTRRNSFTSDEMNVIGAAIRKVKLARAQPIVGIPVMV